MLIGTMRGIIVYLGFSTLQCGSWIDARHENGNRIQKNRVSVPFNAGRGLMPGRTRPPKRIEDSFSTLQCGSWIDASAGVAADGYAEEFQYPSMRVVD